MLWQTLIYNGTTAPHGRIARDMINKLTIQNISIYNGQHIAKPSVSYVVLWLTDTLDKTPIKELRVIKGE